MAFAQRYLIPAALIALIAWGSASANAQTRAPATFKTLMIAQGRERVDGLFYDNGGKQIPLASMSERLSRAYPTPADGLVSLYRELPPVPPDQTPRRVPVTDIRIPRKGGPWLVLMTAPSTPDQAPSDLQTRILDGSVEAHPVGTIRILNFSHMPAMIQIGGDGTTGGSAPIELSAGAETVVPYPANSAEFEIWLKAAFQKNGDWSLKISKPQTIVHGNTRALWILTDIPPSRDFPEPAIRVRNLVEAIRSSLPATAPSIDSAK